MDMKSRRSFVNSMMAATAAAMGGGMLFAQQPQQEPPYTPMGGVQIGPDGVNGNPPPGPIGGPMAPVTGQRRGGGGPRIPRPKPAGIYWISGTGIERWPGPGPNSWDIKDHTKITMENLKTGVERQGGTMDSFLYMQVFFCLRSDDGTPMPKGSAAAAKYQEYYSALGEVYNTYWTGPRPPRSCFALTWIPGNSLIEIVGAAYIDPSVVPPAAPPRSPRGGPPA